MMTSSNSLLVPLLLLSLLSQLPQFVQSGKVLCKPSPLELVFAVDVSSSLTRKDFAQLKEFLKDVVGSLPISKKETQPAVISFSTKAIVEVDLGEAKNWAKFNKGVDAIPYYRGFTATGLAMKLARDTVFPKSRPGASKLLVVVTDGRTNHPGGRRAALRLVNEESRKLRNRGVRIHGVGIGGIWLEDDLKLISGGDDFSVIDGFDSLSKLVNSLVKEICEVHCTDVGKLISLPGQCLNGTQRITHISKKHNEQKNRCEKEIKYEYKHCGQSASCQEIEIEIGDCVNGERPVVTTWEDYDVTLQKCVKRESVQMMDCNAIEECKEPVAEIVFILDSSNSIKNSQWNQQIQFVHKLVQSFKIGANAIRVGIVIFGEVRTTKVEIALGAINDEAQLLNRIQRIRRLVRQNTATGQGIILARQQFKTRARPGVRKMAILMADGETNRGPNPVKAAADLENDEVTIFVVGVGSNLKLKELQSIATPPINEHLFFASTFDKLMAWAAKISTETCETIMPPDPTLCDLPPKRVISDCYRGVQKVTEIRYEFDKVGACTKKMKSTMLNQCKLLCTDPVNGNHYYEGEKWQSECATFTCRRLPSWTTPLLPDKQECMGVKSKCHKANPKSSFKCHDEEQELFSHCRCHAGPILSIITADANN